jgi:hypothetical protein
LRRNPLVASTDHEIGSSCFWLFELGHRSSRVISGASSSVGDAVRAVLYSSSRAKPGRGIGGARWRFRCQRSPPAAETVGDAFRRLGRGAEVLQLPSITPGGAPETSSTPELRPTSAAPSLQTSRADARGSISQPIVRRHRHGIGLAAGGQVSGVRGVYYPARRTGTPKACTCQASGCPTAPAECTARPALRSSYAFSSR